MIYTANLAGGAVGTVLAGFYLLRVYDTVIAGAVAVVINIAVAINGVFVPRSTYTNRQLHNGDLIDVVKPVGGG